MFSLYYVILFIHIACAVIWLGGATLLEIIHIRICRAPTEEKIKEFFAMGDWLSPRVFMPMAVLVLFSGITLVLMAGSFADLWIIIALTGIIIASILGATIIGPTVKKLNELFNNRGVNQNEIQKYQRRLQIVSNIDLGILFVILFDMVLKPTLNSKGFFVISILFLMAIFFYAFADKTVYV